MAEVIFDESSGDIYSATIHYWYVDEGEHVEAGDDLVEVKTQDDRYFTVQAPVSGTLKERFYDEEDEVEIGEVIAEIDEEEEDVEEEDEEGGLEVEEKGKGTVDEDDEE